MERGFLAARPGLERRFLEVDDRVHSAAKQVVRSMELHLKHDMLVGETHHHARLATLAARELLPRGTLVDALATHRAAGRAKHGVSAAAASATSSARRGAVRWSSLEDDVTEDLVFANDPWALAASRRLGVRRPMLKQNNGEPDAWSTFIPSRTREAGGKKKGVEPAVVQDVDGLSAQITELRSQCSTYELAIQGLHGSVEKLSEGLCALKNGIRDLIPSVRQSLDGIISETVANLLAERAPLPSDGGPSNDEATEAQFVEAPVPLCRNLSTKGYCKFGDGCFFRHIGTDKAFNHDAKSVGTRDGSDDVPPRGDNESWCRSRPVSGHGAYQHLGDPCDTDIDDYLCGVFAPITLAKLKATHLNGASGEVLFWDEQSKRYAVKLTKGGDTKKFKKENLRPYERGHERCDLCQEPIDLFSCPPCGCGFGADQDTAAEGDVKAKIRKYLSSSTPPVRLIPERDICFSGESVDTTSDVAKGDGKERAAMR